MTTLSTDPENSQQQNLPARPHWRQLTLQCAAAFAVLSVAWPYFGIRGEALPWPETAFAIGCVALLIATLTHQPWWWRVIHTLFAPLAWGISNFSINPGWFLLAFILMLVVYRGAITGQIPLFFSNSKTVAALSELTSEYPTMRFIDLGAGIGSVLRPLATALPEAQLTGIENAPATWFFGYLRTIGQTHCEWRFGDIWSANLANFDVVYTYLSPAPMTEMWKKVQREMRPGGLFISNSFPISEVEPDSVVLVDDTRQTRLYCYRR